jgi:general secretion pathway protein A
MLTGPDLWGRPFQPTCDLRFLWLGPAQRDTLAALKNAVLGPSGLLVLTGGIGAGKTLLAHALLAELGEAAVVAQVPHPDVEPLDCWVAVARAWGFEAGDQTRAAFVQSLSQFLTRRAAQSPIPLLFIDEAQSLHHKVCIEIEHILTVGRASKRRPTVLLVGQRELLDLLAAPERAALSHWTRLRGDLRTLTEAEVVEYVRHRLAVAGCQRDLFTPDALGDIAAASHGIPRLINSLCNLALWSASQANLGAIDARLLRESARQLGMAPGLTDPPSAREWAEGTPSWPGPQLPSPASLVGHLAAPVRRTVSRWSTAVKSGVSAPRSRAPAAQAQGLPWLHSPTMPPVEELAVEDDRAEVRRKPAVGVGRFLIGSALLLMLGVSLYLTGWSEKFPASPELARWFGAIPPESGGVAPAAAPPAARAVEPPGPGDVALGRSGLAGLGDPEEVSAEEAPQVPVRAQERAEKIPRERGDAPQSPAKGTATERSGTVTQGVRPTPAPWGLGTASRTSAESPRPLASQLPLVPASPPLPEAPRTSPVLENQERRPGVSMGPAPRALGVTEPADMPEAVKGGDSPGRGPDRHAERAETEDAGAIIDWLLQAYPGRRADEVIR